MFYHLGASTGGCWPHRSSGLVYSGLPADWPGDNRSDTKDYEDDGTADNAYLCLLINNCKICYSTIPFPHIYTIYFVCACKFPESFRKKLKAKLENNSLRDEWIEMKEINGGVPMSLLCSLAPALSLQTVPQPHTFTPSRHKNAKLHCRSQFVCHTNFDLQTVSWLMWWSVELEPCWEQLYRFKTTDWNGYSSPLLFLMCKLWFMLLIRLYCVCIIGATDPKANKPR